MSTVNATADKKENKQGKGLSFERVFSQQGTHPFDELEWEKREVAITGDDGDAVFEQKDVEVPKGWSELASKIAVSKYFYGDIQRGTVPTEGGRESSMRQLMERVCRTLADWGHDDGYFASKEDADTFYSELVWLCINQFGAFNSPVWFNVGLHHLYGVGKDGDLGNYVYNPETKKAERARSQYKFPQGSACFIQSVEDNMEDIMRLAKSEAMLFKYGSGTGSDLSTLRSTREKLSGGGRPSGPLSFLKVFDQIADVVKSGGKTRRAAKMNTLKDWHPDIEEFIVAKTLEEKKAWALIDAGYGGAYNCEAYGAVMFQNENLTVRASDEFLNAAERGGEWWTRTVTDGKKCEKKDAKALLKAIAKGTHICGDPGMQYDSTIHKWHTCKSSGRQNSTNPCSEYLFLDNTACNLASLNLMKFKKADGEFDLERFKSAVRIFITAQDILVDRSSYPTAEISENSHVFRTLGLGYANLGSLIMSYGFGYDSDEARGIAGAITAVMTGQAYQHSAVMAEKFGAFEGYHNAAYGKFQNPENPDNVESMREVMHLHRNEINNIHVTAGFEHLVDDARKLWDDAITTGDASGYRNAQVTVLAPTGTIGFLMDCDTTGIEPDIALVKYKLLAGGGMLKLVNRTVPEALTKLGYDDETQAKVIAHIEEFDTVEDAIDPDTGECLAASPLKPEHMSVFDCAFSPRCGSRSLSYMGHLRMMAAAQPFLSGAISKTVNMPEEASVDEIMQTYIEAWKMGLKCVAIYRDGSKRSAPVVTDKKKHGPSSGEDSETLQIELLDKIDGLQGEVDRLKPLAEQPTRRHLSDTRTSLTHKFEIAGHEGYLMVGHYENGDPGEVFIQMSKEGSTIGGLMDTVATLTSLALQYGVPLEDLVNKFAYQRFEPSGFTKNPDIRNATSIIDYVFRWLGCQYIAGYKEATAPGGSTPTLPGIEEIEKKAVNRPVSDLAVQSSAKVPANKVDDNHPDRLKRAFANVYMDTPCSNCGSYKVIRAGACGCCTECGTSQGCS